ncbi:MAG TPA: CDP-alcohol phosphatidyltransferase family protein [Myxococcota bacterium]
MLKSRFGFAFDAAVLRVAPFLSHPSVHPNALTLFGTAISLAAAAEFAGGELRRGAALTALGGAFDLCDGVAARAQGRASRFGALLDSSLDRLVDVALLFGLALYYAGEGQRLWAWVAGVGLAGSVLTSYTKARAELWLRDFDAGLLERAERILLLIAGGALGLMPLALAGIALGSVATAIQRIIIAHRRLGAEPEEGRHE